MTSRRWSAVCEAWTSLLCVCLFVLRNLGLIPLVKNVTVTFLSTEIWRHNSTAGGVKIWRSPGMWDTGFDSLLRHNQLFYVVPYYGIHWPIVLFDEKCENMLSAMGRGGGFDSMFRIQQWQHNTRPHEIVCGQVKNMESVVKSGFFRCMRFYMRSKINHPCKLSSGQVICGTLPVRQVVQNSCVESWALQVSIFLFVCACFVLLRRVLQSGSISLVFAPSAAAPEHVATM